jgi:Glycosyl hydrolase family 62
MNFHLTRSSSLFAGIFTFAVASVASLYATIPAAPPADAQGASGANTTAPSASAPATGARRGRGPGRGRGNANLGPVPEIHTPISNTLPGLLGKPIKWVSTGPLVVPQNDASHFLFSIKDPTFAYVDGQWEIYATANMIMGSQAAPLSQPGATRPARGGTFNMVHVSFKDWKDAPNAKLFYMDQAGFTGYKCAPEMFYFTPQKKWYFTFQTQPPVYCTSDTPGDPKSWTRPEPFFAQGTPMPGLPIDFHFIGDGQYMYMFFTGDDGFVYRSRTTYADFPKGFSNPVYAIAGTRNTVFEAGFAYKIKGVDKYLYCVEGLGAGRYYSAYVADKLDGEWYPVEGFNSPEKPFAGKANMTFEDGVAPWSGQVSHGEMLRQVNDERMVLDPDNLQFLYQGIGDAENRGDYGALPYKVGLLRAMKY